MRVGYVRVGTVDQNTVRQFDGIEVGDLHRHGVREGHRPAEAGRAAGVRSDGDTVIVPMDRLARNLDDLRRLRACSRARGCGGVRRRAHVHGEDSPMATLLLSVMAFAEFERALIPERQREGIAAAKQRGVYSGANPPSPLSRPAA
jgi:DNA invertase Pin-like site-specific DNA recombinase